MSPKTIKRILDSLEYLSKDLSGARAENLIFQDVLVPLYQQEGYQIRDISHEGKFIDFIASKSNKITLGQIQILPWL